MEMLKTWTEIKGRLKPSNSTKYYIPGLKILTLIGRFSRSCWWLYSDGRRSLKKIDIALQNYSKYQVLPKRTKTAFRIPFTFVQYFLKKENPQCWFPLHELSKQEKMPYTQYHGSFCFNQFLKLSSHHCITNNSFFQLLVIQ